MVDLSDKKYFSAEITERFFLAMDRIVGSRSSGKVTAKSFGDIVGISSSNLNRIRTSNGEYFVTVEALGRLCHHFSVSGEWLITGTGDMEASQDFESRLSEAEKTIEEIKPILPKIKDLIK